ncbi:MAG: DedA family protein/thiosulfate sulfurtransferase GlpE [Betaproteobacteria bacterium]
MESLLAGLAHYGAWFVGGNVLLQQLGLPVPAVPTLVVAGALAAVGTLNGALVLAAAVAASVVADCVWFVAGRRYGYQVLRLLCRISLSPDTCVRETEGIFERWGFYSIVLSKFIPGFSTVGPPMAGALRMPIARFLAASMASATLWAGAALVVGWVFAAQVEYVLAWMTAHLVAATLWIVAALALYIGWKALQRYRLARFVHSARITVDELRDIITGDAPPMVIDIGSNLAHQSRPHIAGAALMDLDRIAREAMRFPTDRDIVIYCACPNEESSKRAAQILRAKGFTRARPLIGGIDAWVAAGGDVEMGVPITIVRETADAVQ